MDDHVAGARAASITNNTCPCCGKPVLLAEDAVLIEVVLVSFTGSAPFMNGKNFAYRPWFYHDACWQAELESLETAAEEELTAVPVHNASATCMLCGSGILPNEPSLSVSRCLLERSVREPNNLPSCNVVRRPGDDYLCTCCTRLLNDMVTELWPDGFSFNRECPECTQARSWRHGAVCDHEDED